MRGCESVAAEVSSTRCVIRESDAARRWSADPEMRCSEIDARLEERDVELF